MVGELAENHKWQRSETDGRAHHPASGNAPRAAHASGRQKATSPPAFSRCCRTTRPRWALRGF